MWNAGVAAPDASTPACAEGANSVYGSSSVDGANSSQMTTTAFATLGIMAMVSF